MDTNSNSNRDSILEKAKEKKASRAKTLAGSKRKDRNAEDDKKDSIEAGRSSTKRIERSQSEELEDASEDEEMPVVDFLHSRVEDRLAGLVRVDETKPKSIVEDKIRSNGGEKEYTQALGRLSTEKPKPEHIRKLEMAAGSGPNYLGRTTSLTAGHNFGVWKRGTNGFTTQTLMMPAADTNEDQGVHVDISDLTQGELAYMLGQHLMWHDIPGDEFLSYSKDPLFLIVHALNRYHEKQGAVTIQFFDRRRAKNVKGERATFYTALELYEAFDVPKCEGWRGPSTTKLRARKFTQEYLSHGTIKVDDIRFQQALVEQLIKDGLYDIFPAFSVPDDHTRAGLYSGQVVFRKHGFPPNDTAKHYRRIYSYDHCENPVAFTTEFLKKVQKVTRNFMNISSSEDAETGEPHLHIFLSFLTFQKRAQKDDVFIKWIASHYTPNDVVDLYTDGEGGIRPGFTKVASNLPGVMQYLDLVRDAVFAFGLPELSPTVVEKRNGVTGEWYADDDDRMQKYAVASKKYDGDDHQDRKDRAKAVRRKKRAAKNGFITKASTFIDITEAEELGEEAGKNDPGTERGNGEEEDNAETLLLNSNPENEDVDLE